jgi:formylglycine-generating enzyme required for sulfatase activity
MRPVNSRRAAVLPACLFLASLWASGYCRAQEQRPSELAGVTPGEAREFGGDLKIKMGWCPAGSFRMGSPDSDSEANDNEKPQVDVTLDKGFWLGQTEVTQGLWKSVMATARWQEKLFVEVGDQHPAVYVSHGGDRDRAEADSAQAFCVALTKLEQDSGRLPANYAYRLPTVAEWEYACRAGSTSKYSFGDDASRLSDYAWFGVRGDEADEFAHAVATRRSNAWSLFDMHGNIWEWCEDGHDARLPEGKDRSVHAASNRVFRGGCWNYSAEYCRSANRIIFTEPSSRYFHSGFRLALSSARK